MPTPANAKKAAAKKHSAKASAPAKSAKKSAKPSSKPQILSSRVSYQGKVFSVTTDKVIEPGGVTVRRDTVRHSGSIVVLAVDTATHPADPTILIERQYRHSAGQFLLELPAGRIEPGEAPLAAARRELIEETGFRAKKWSKLTRYYASPGFLAETMQIFLAEDIRAGMAAPEEDEKIELLHIPLSELLNLIHTGKILDGKTILGVLFYARWHFDQVK